MLRKLKQKIFEWFWLASGRGNKHQLWHFVRFRAEWQAFVLEGNILYK
jgi:hypothetical protein